MINRTEDEVIKALLSVSTCNSCICRDWCKEDKDKTCEQEIRDWLNGGDAGWNYNKKPEVKYGACPHFFVDLKHKEGTASFRTTLRWDSYQECWEWDNGKRLADKYEVLAWKKVEYPPASKGE